MNWLHFHMCRHSRMQSSELVLGWHNTCTKSMPAVQVLNRPEVLLLAQVQPPWLYFGMFTFPMWNAMQRCLWAQPQCKASFYKIYWKCISSGTLTIKKTQNIMWKTVVVQPPAPDCKRHQGSQRVCRSKHKICFFGWTLSGSFSRNRNACKIINK